MCKFSLCFSITCQPLIVSLSLLAFACPLSAQVDLAPKGYRIEAGFDQYNSDKKKDRASQIAAARAYRDNAQNYINACEKAVTELRPQLNTNKSIRDGLNIEIKELKIALREKRQELSEREEELIKQQSPSSLYTKAVQAAEDSEKACQETAGELLGKPVKEGGKLRLRILLKPSDYQRIAENAEMEAAWDQLQVNLTDIKMQREKILNQDKSWTSISTEVKKLDDQERDKSNQAKQVSVQYADINKAIVLYTKNAKAAIAGRNNAQSTLASLGAK